MSTPKAPMVRGLSGMSCSRPAATIACAPTVVAAIPRAFTAAFAAVRFFATSAASGLSGAGSGSESTARLFSSSMPCNEREKKLHWEKRRNTNRQRGWRSPLPTLRPHLLQQLADRREQPPVERDLLRLVHALLKPNGKTCEIRSLLSARQLQEEWEAVAQARRGSSLRPRRALSFTMPMEPAHVTWSNRKKATQESALT